MPRRAVWCLAVRMAHYGEWSSGEAEGLQGSQASPHWEALMHNTLFPARQHTVLRMLGAAPDASPQRVNDWITRYVALPAFASGDQDHLLVIL